MKGNTLILTILLDYETYAFANVALSEKPASMSHGQDVL